MIRRLSLAVLAVIALATPARAQMARLTESLGSLEKRVRTDSADPVAHYQVGLAYWSYGRFDDAERALKQALVIDPQFAPGYLSLSLLPYARRPKLWEEEEKGKVPAELKEVVEESDRSYRRAFMVDPLVDLQSIALFFRRRISSGGVGRDEQFARGIEFFYVSQFDQAHASLHRALPSDAKGRAKTGSTALWYHALSAAHVGAWDEALADLTILRERALEVERVAPAAGIGTFQANQMLYLIAVVEQRAGRTREAVAHYEEVLANDIGMYMAHVQLANMHEKNGVYARALTERRRAIAANPYDGSLEFDLGVTLARAGQFASADSVLGGAMASNPANGRIPYMLGLVRRQLGDTAGARSAFDRFLAMAPSSYGEQVADVRRRMQAK